MANTCSDGFFQCAKFQNYWDGFEKYSLPTMAADAETITVSGFSSGAGMAGAMHVIYSDTFKGAGILAGSSYMGFLDYYEPYDSSDESYESIRKIMADGYDQTYLDAAMNTAYTNGFIDNPSNL